MLALIISTTPRFWVEAATILVLLYFVICVALACMDRMDEDDSPLPLRHCPYGHAPYYSDRDGCPVCERIAAREAKEEAMCR